MKVPMRINTQFRSILKKCGIYCGDIGENVPRLRHIFYLCKPTRLLFGFFKYQFTEDNIELQGIVRILC